MQGYRIFNTWTGDHTRLVTLEAVVKEIQEKNLLDLVRESGSVLLSGLQALEVSWFVYASVSELDACMPADQLSQPHHERPWSGLVLCCGLS